MNYPDYSLGDFIMKIKIGFFAAMLFLSLLITHSYFAVAALCAVLIHELGHILIAKIRNIKFAECRISIFGAGLTPCYNDYSYTDEIILCIGGPAANIITAFLMLFLFAGSKNEIILYFIVSSITLALFNLMPIKDLDGGRILYSLLCICNDPYRSERILSVISFILIFIFWIISVYFILIAKANLSLFVFSISLFTRIFIKKI